MIPPAFVHDLLSRVDLVDLVGRYVPLKKAGINHKGLCPFHAEKSPSFIVSPTRQTYHCFGCGAHGNAVGFLMEHSAMGFIDAVRDLAQQVGLKVPEEDSTPAERERAAALKKRQTTLSEALEQAATHYQRELKASPQAIHYLKQRGLSGEVAARFGLGFAPDSWRGLANVFPRYDDPVLEESGMVISAAAADGNDGVDAKRYDRFRGRIMFPIRSVQGEVIGFGGRVLDRAEPKYLNSPETPVFSKGRELYGLHEARIGLRQRGYALVVEGYMDVVALAQAGFTNAVATLGTACTSEHIQKLFRFTEAIVFSFDGDAAGRRAASRALEASLPHATDTRSVRFLFLPSEHDPDSYVRALGAAAFEARVNEAVPLSNQLMALASEGCELSSAEGRARMLANAKPLWAALPAGVLQRQLLGELALLARLELAELQTLWGSVAAPLAKPHSHRQAWRSPVRVSKGAANLLDRAVWLLIQRSELWLTLDDAVHDELAAKAAPYDLFFGCIERQVLEHGPVGASTLLESLRDTATQHPQGGVVIERIAQFHDPEPQASLLQELQRVLERLRLKDVEDELELLFESGSISADAQQRSCELMAIRAQLKAKLA